VAKFQPAAHRSILIIDVERFGDPARTNAHQLAVRAGMYKVLQQSLSKARITKAQYTTEDRGDGVLVLISPEVPKSQLVTRVPANLAEALDRHNADSSTEARIRLRMVLHAGEVHPDTHGVTGYAIIHAFRLIEAPELKSALRASLGGLALIVSDWFYNEVVRHDATERAWFSHVSVAIKETATGAWVRVLEPAGSASEVRAPLGNRTYMYRIVDDVPANRDRRIGIIAGSIRKVQGVDVWVNPENTDMKMSRFEERTISAIIRYEGARRDGAGHVVDDLIADELAAKVTGICPTAAGAVVTTGPGELAHSHDVRHVIHVAAVHGEPGAGYRQVHDIGQCVTGALTEADLVSRSHPVTSILFPLLGAGQGGGDVDETARTLLGAAADYLTGSRDTQITTVYFLAHTDAELIAFRETLQRSPQFAAS
jgi:O-acetyl-ADP-ribose deacetylase (regulator of RNase III)